MPTSEWQLRKYHRRRKVFIRLFGGKCKKCESNDRLEFDHIDPKTKSFNIGQAWTKPLLEVYEELKKCQLLCYSCHRKKSGQERIPDRHGTWGWVRNRKCKCDICREFVNAYQRKRNAR